MFGEIEKHTKIPIALGFGVSHKEQVAELKRDADGIIVGSAMVKIIEKYGEESREHLLQFANEMVAEL